jgi:hypothetical protein
MWAIVDTTSQINDTTALIYMLIAVTAIAIEELLGRLTIWNRAKIIKIFQFFKKINRVENVYNYTLSQTGGMDIVKDKLKHVQNIYLNTEMLVEFSG